MARAALSSLIRREEKAACHAGYPLERCRAAVYRGQQDVVVACRLDGHVERHLVAYRKTGVAYHAGDVETGVVFGDNRERLSELHIPGEVGHDDFKVVVLLSQKYRKSVFQKIVVGFVHHQGNGDRRTGVACAGVPVGGDASVVPHPIPELDEKEDYHAGQQGDAPRSAGFPKVCVCG